MAVRRSITPNQLKKLQKRIKPLIPGFERLKQHVVITDPEANILYMNSAAEQTTGYTLKEAEGKNPADLWGGGMPDDFYSEMWATIKQSKKPFMGEVENTRKDGVAYWQEILISPIVDAQHNVQFFIAIEPNVTARKKSEEFIENLTYQLAQSRHLLQAIHKTIRLICQYTEWVYGEVWMMDQKSKKLKQAYSWSSQPKKLKRFSQISKEFTFAPGQGLPGRVWRSKKPEWIQDVTVLPKKVFLRVSAAKTDGVKAAFAQPLIVNKQIEAVLVFFMPEAKPADEQMIRFIQSAIKKLSFLFEEKLLGEHLNVLGQGIESSKDAIVVTNREGNILYTNSAWEKLVARPKVKILGEKVQIVWDHGMPKSFFDQMWETVLKHKRSFSQEVKLAYKNKPERWQQIRVAPIKDEHGQVKYIFAVATDTSKLKAKDKFRDEFISIIGHQLKSPLTNTRWTLELLMDQKKINQTQKKDLEILYNQNKNILNLVGDLLVLSRVEKAQVQTERVSLVKELNSILAMVKANHPLVHYSFKPEKPVELNVNKTLAQQVFYNIIMNAAEYTAQKTGRVTLELKVKGHQATFVCSDNGVGIPKAEQKRVFSQFFRGSNTASVKQDGTGLGLFIVKLITDTLGWKVTFNSIEKKGTTFFVQFPLK